jgi:hypothetical protein
LLIAAISFHNSFGTTPLVKPQICIVITAIAAIARIICIDFMEGGLQLSSVIEARDIGSDSFRLPQPDPKRNLFRRAKRSKRKNAPNFGAP